MLIIACFTRLCCSVLFVCRDVLRFGQLLQLPDLQRVVSYHLFSPVPALENITWCINIPFQDRDVETCMRVGSDGGVVTNSTCEAEMAEIPKSLSFPDVSFENT